MGVKGALAVSTALLVNTQIRSLNLGDNWLRDDGAHAIAQVLNSNHALTSINLADNKIGLPGVLSICTNLESNSTLAELSLKGNDLNDRSAKPLAEALKNSSSLTKVDLSYNAFGEEAGLHFGEMLNGHTTLRDVNLKWNALKAKGGMAVAEGLKANSALQKVDLGWNGLGDGGIKAVADMLGANESLTHIDVSHNRVNPQGCLDLAEGIKNNHQLLSLELSFNPMGVATTFARADGSVAGKLSNDSSGIVALIDAVRQSESIESVGLSNVQSGGSYARGRASRFDPKNPDGHYALDLAQPWDRFIAETLYERMSHEKGESWINTTWAKGSGSPPRSLDVPVEGWKMPRRPKGDRPPSDGKEGTAEDDGEPYGTLEFDYVTWKRGLEASFRLDLSNPCDLFLGEKLMQRAQAAEGGGDGDGAEELRECKLNDEPIDSAATLPNHGTLQIVYFSTLQQDTINFPIELDLSAANNRAIVLRLWERALTTPTDYWASCSLDGGATSYEKWNYPHVPGEGTISLEYAVKLAIKPYDRGVFFTQPMEDKAAFPALVNTLRGTKAAEPSDFDRLNLLKQAALRNYFTSQQVKSLLDCVGYRKGKIEAAILLHPRTTDQPNFSHALRSLDKEQDRNDILEMVGASIKRKTKSAFQTAHQLDRATNLLTSIAASKAAPQADGIAPAGAPATGAEQPAAAAAS